jgi:hypothetical protein
MGMPASSNELRSMVFALLIGLLAVPTLPLVAGCLGMALWALQGPYRSVDSSLWRYTVEQLLDASLPSDVQVENCVQEVDSRDPGPMVRLSGPAAAMAELRRRIPDHAVEPLEELDWHSELAWFSLPDHELECQLSRFHRAGFIAYVSKPVNGRVTMIAQSFD